MISLLWPSVMGVIFGINLCQTYSMQLYSFEPLVYGAAGTMARYPRQPKSHCPILRMLSARQDSDDHPFCKSSIRPSWQVNSQLPTRTGRSGQIGKSACFLSERSGVRKPVVKPMTYKIDTCHSLPSLALSITGLRKGLVSSGSG